MVWGSSVGRSVCENCPQAIIQTIEVLAMKIPDLKMYLLEPNTKHPKINEDLLNFCPFYACQLYFTETI